MLKGTQKHTQKVVTLIYINKSCFSLTGTRQEEDDATEQTQMHQSDAAVSGDYYLSIIYFYWNQHMYQFLFLLYQIVIKYSCYLARGNAWHCEENLGQGGYGKVELWKNRQTGERKAVKIIPIDNNRDEQRRYLREISVLEIVKHDNIVGYIDFHIDNNSILYIHMEYISGGSLQNLLEIQALSWEHSKPLLRQILEGIAYLHSLPKPIVHGDLKSQNILMTENGKVKLADFGTSRILNNATSTITVQLMGTLKFIAPELFDDDCIRVTVAADIWSVGCVLVQMLTQNPPWGEFKKLQLMSKIALKKKPIYTLPENVSPGVNDILDLCFNYDPKKRPTANTLLGNSFLA